MYLYKGQRTAVVRVLMHTPISPKVPRMGRWVSDLDHGGMEKGGLLYSVISAGYGKDVSCTTDLNVITDHLRQQYSLMAVAFFSRITCCAKKNAQVWFEEQEIWAVSLQSVKCAGKTIHENPILQLPGLLKSAANVLVPCKSYGAHISMGQSCFSDTRGT